MAINKKGITILAVFPRQRQEPKHVKFFKVKHACQTGNEQDIHPEVGIRKTEMRFYPFIPADICHNIEHYAQ